MNQDFLDALALVSFMVGLANYNENLTQSDKDDLMRGLDEKTNRLLTELQKEINKQNEILAEILRILERIQNGN